MLDNMIPVARETRKPEKVPVGSSLHAKKSIKVNGVMDRSLQSRTVRMRSSIRLIVLVSNMNLAPSIWKNIDI